MAGQGCGKPKVKVPTVSQKSEGHPLRATDQLLKCEWQIDFPKFSQCYFKYMMGSCLQTRTSKQKANNPPFAQLTLPDIKFPIKFNSENFGVWVQEWAI